MPTPEQSRLIKLCHVARRDLQLDEDTWRAMLMEVTGKRSSKELTVPQLNRVLGHLKEKGFKVRKPKAAAPAERRPLDSASESQKARAVWLLLVEIGTVRDPSEAALNAYVRRQAGVDDLRWVKDMAPVIEGLKAWAARKLPSAIQARMEALVQAGVVLPWRSVPELARAQAPKANPACFTALWAAWDALKAYVPKQAAQ
ncbi:MAG: regulatory protein GemA [Proteobacteria bacterium]|nr:regulatory protein GemA [Pseudomonadota bacterium]